MVSTSPIDPTTPDGSAADGAVDPVVAAVQQLVAVLRASRTRGLTSAVLVDRIAALEQLKNVASAQQTSLGVAFEAAQFHAQEHAGVPARPRGRGIVEQIALARRQSPAQAARFLAHARILFLDLPATMSRFAAGDLSEYRAGLIATKVALLDPAGRAEVDAQLNPEADPSDPVTSEGGPGPDLAAMGDRAVRTAAAAAAYRIDPSIVRRRGRHAESERYVSVHPAADTMTVLSAYLPVRQGVACSAALRQAADAARAAGDERTRNQVMADTLVARLIGAEHPGAIPLELQIIMTDHDLFADAMATSQTTNAPATNAPSGASVSRCKFAW